MDVAAIFCEDSEIDDLFYKGQLTQPFQYPYTDMPENFEQSEKVIFKKLEATLAREFNPEKFDVGYDTWADPVIRMSVDVNELSPRFLSLLVNFLHNEASGHLVFCLVEDYEKAVGSYLGRIVFNSSRLMVSSSLREIWSQQIGSKFEDLSLLFRTP